MRPTIVMLAALVCSVALGVDAANHGLRGAVRITSEHDETHVEKTVTPIPGRVEVELFLEQQAARFSCNSIPVSNETLKLIEGDVSSECDGKHLSAEMVMSLKVAGWRQVSTVACQTTSCWVDVHVIRPEHAAPADRKTNYDAALASLQRQNLYEATFFLRECSVGGDEEYTRKARAVLNQTNDLSCYPKPTSCQPIWNAPLQ
jgi:hypothetical protein